MEHKLEVVRENNTKAALCFVPVQLSSKKSVNNEARKKTGMNSIFKYIYNGNINATTNKLTSVGYALLYELNVIQTKNQKLSINYKIMEALNQILALPSIKLMVNYKRMKGVTHVNIIPRDNVNTIRRNS